MLHFEWDPTKSFRNVAERGFDFAFASGIFAGPTLERDDERFDYGERRRIAIGRVLGRTLTVVYTDRAAVGGVRVRRIISARRSKRRETEAYEAVAGR